MNCPKCGAQQQGEPDGRRVWWQCGSYGVDRVNHQSDWCLERESHNETRRALDFYKRRANLLQSVQKHMRDPERTLVCDILANGQLLPDPQGKRYGFATTGNEHLCRPNDQADTRHE